MEEEKALKLIEINKKSIEKLILQFGECEKAKTRCGQAVFALKSLKETEEMVLTFIKKNYLEIDALFHLLHKPKEFKDLSITEDGITVTRNTYYGEDKNISAIKMSTGQRVSLALAVMFTIYFNAADAPNFLLLDEPIANLDDLHLINMLEILRCIALNGTQIFITTANKELMKIMRRKFSFLENDYKEFKLSRNGKEKVQIIERTYNPQKESIVERNISQN